MRFQRSFLLTTAFLLVLSFQTLGYDIVKLGPSYFPESTRNRPVANGKIYVGIPGLDPEVVANQQQLYIQEEDGDIIAVAQPIYTSAGGVPVYSGSPVTLLVNNDYSLKVLNSAGVQVYYVPLVESSENLGNAYTPDYNATDQGVTGSNNTIKYFVDLIGATNKATIFLRHNSGSAQTVYTLTTSETIPANITIKFESGAIINGVGTLTFAGSPDSQIKALPGQQIFGTDLTVTFGLGGNTYPEWIGAKGDGTTDDTIAIEKMALSGCDLNISKIYGVKTVSVANGLRSIKGSGTLKCLADDSQGIIELAGTFFSTTPVDNLEISGITLDGNSKINMAIFVGGGSTGINIHDCRITNLTETAGDVVGIYFSQGCYWCKATKNTINQPVGSVSAIGILLVGNYPDIYGAYFDNADGTTTAAVNPPHDNTIQGNTIYQGTHGIIVMASTYNNIVGNILINQSQRSIILSPVSSHNEVSGNLCRGFGSSGIHLAYGSNYNTITGNNLYSPTASGEAGLQAYVACYGNLFSGNKVYAASNYGCYLAIGSSGNTISNNDFSYFTLAGIAIESDWQETNPVSALYSRPNYGAPIGTKWAYQDSDKNAILNNIIRDPVSSGQGAIYIASTDGPTGTAVAKVTNTYIKGNTVTSVNNTWDIYVYTETATYITGTYLQGNTFSNNTKLYFSEPYYQIEASDGNTFLNFSLSTPDDVAFANGDTTPSVANSTWFAFANSAPTSVTMFDDGYPRQEITVRMDVNTTIVHNDSYIRLAGAANITGRNANDFVHFRNIGGIWFEQYRNW